MKTIYLIRHAKTVENEKNIYCGQKPGKLSKKGREEAMRLRRYLSNVDYDIVLTSDLKRAVDTSKIINVKNKRIIKLSLLRERSLGGLIIKKERYNKIIKNSKKICEFKFPNGESYIDVLKRVKLFLDYLKNLKCNKILVVSHGRFNKILINYLLEKPLCNEIRQENCCVNLIKIGKEVKVEMIYPTKSRIESELNFCGTCTNKKIFKIKHNIKGG